MTPGLRSHSLLAADLFWAVIGAGAAAAAAPAGPDVTVVEGRRYLTVGGQRLLELGVPWVTTVDWKPVRSFPAQGAETEETTATGRSVVREDSGAHGLWRERRTETADSVTLRYEFEFADVPGAAHLQWYWRLEPARFDGAYVAGEGQRPLALRRIEGAAVDGLRQLAFVLPDLDLEVACSAGDGEWQFRDARSAEWAHCYRLEYNRDFAVAGRRTGWFEVTLRARPAADVLVPLTTGEPTTVRGLRFHPGPLAVLPEGGRRLAAVLAWHTATGPAAAGAAVGSLTVTYADDTSAVVPLAWERAVGDPADDPRDLAEGALAPLPDGSPAWVTAWRNPKPGVPVRTLAAATLRANWRLAALTGVEAGADERRLAALFGAARGGPLAETLTVSLDGTWRLQPAGGEERDVTVPAFWDSLPGGRELHQATCRRTFDVPAAMEGQRVLLRFDAVGDAAAVTVNGQHAGQHLGPALPFEVDITGLVSAPSTGNRLEVLVSDDTHFSVPRPSSDWRNRRHWIPRGMGTNNRKGLYQSVSLLSRPALHVADVRIRTTVREPQLAVTWSVFNSRRETVQARLEGEVRPWAGGGAVVTLPATPVELPGLVTTTVAVTVPYSGVELWQPDHPALYALRTRLLDAAGKRLHRVDTRFGFREVGFEGIHFTLNGIRCNLRGESPAYAEKSGLFATREAATEMVRRFQRANCNVLRFHALPAPPHVLDVCDELGMLVIDESGIYASWQMLLPEHPGWMDACREHLARWVRRDRLHPAVVLWSAENEGLNVSVLTPAMLAEFRRIIDEHDGSRPVVFDGDGTGYGASPASVKHYVRTIDDLKERGGRSSGYARDLRHDIYWATAYTQDVPLGCGEFMFPYEPGLRDRERDVVYSMGLQARGYRLADWFDIRPYNPSYSGFLRPEGVRPGYEEAYDVLVKSFAPVAVFDREYDALGPFPAPPRLARGTAARRTLIVYNDTFAGEAVQVEWRAVVGGQPVGGRTCDLRIPLGGHTTVEAEFTPGAAGELTLELVSRKDGREQFRDARRFAVE